MPLFRIVLLLKASGMLFYLMCLKDTRSKGSQHTRIRLARTRKECLDCRISGGTLLPSLLLPSTLDATKVTAQAAARSRGQRHTARGLSDAARRNGGSGTQNGGWATQHEEPGLQGDDQTSHARPRGLTDVPKGRRTRHLHALGVSRTFSRVGDVTRAK